MKVGDKVLVKSDFRIAKIVDIHTFPDLNDGYKMAGVTVYYLDGSEGYFESDQFLTKEQIDSMFLAEEIVYDEKTIALAVLYKLVYDADFGVLANMNEIFDALTKVKFVRNE